MGSTRRQMLAQGAAPARAADAAPVRQPDDPLRALDGRDRRADRRPGPRRRRHERPLLRTRRSRSSPGVAIVIMAIALDRVDRGDGGADRPDAAPSHRRAQARRLRLVHRSRCAAGVGARGRPRATRSTPASVWSRTTAQRLAARPDPERARLRPEPEHVHLPHHEPDRRTSSSSTGSCRCGTSSSRRRGRRWLFGLTLIAFLVSGLRPAVTTFAMLALIGVIGEWTPAMDTLSQVLVATVLTMLVGIAARRLGGREQPRRRRSCDRCSTCCRRCRSSSTSSRSST